MEKYIGKSVYKGTAIGPVSVLKKKDSLVKRIHIDNTAEELKRLEDFRKAQAEVEKKDEKPMSQKMFKVI